MNEEVIMHDSEEKTQIQGSVAALIVKVIINAQKIVSNACIGIDDMQLQGNKTLVIRAEIYPEPPKNLYIDLALILTSKVYLI